MRLASRFGYAANQIRRDRPLMRITVKEIGE